METLSKASIRDLLSNVLRENPTWTQLAEAIADVFSDNIEAPIDQTANIRSMRQDTDPKILEQTTRLLGFDLTRDVLTLTEESLTKIVTQLPLYPLYNSTALFKNFVELILNSLVNVEYLFTQNYVAFYPAPKGPLVHEGGSWFKTTHINLDVSLLNLASLDLSNATDFFARVQEIFYNFAPITLVIREFYFGIVFSDTDWVGGSAFGIAVGLEVGSLELTVS